MSDRSVEAGGVLVRPLSEQDITPEIRLGTFEIEYILNRSLISLSQVREVQNPKVYKIMESIQRRLKNPHTKDQALINPIAVAKLNQNTFNEYIGAINEIWGSEHKIEDYQATNGHYNLIVAGHTRNKAGELIEEAEGIAVIMPCVISRDLSVEEIISTQLDENTYEAPSQERRAMAMAEYYYYGINKNLWTDEREFRTYIGNKFDKESLEQALYFASLPEKIRAFVFVQKNKLPYSVAVSLGESLPIVADYFTEKYQKEGADTDSEEVGTKIAESVELWLDLTVAHVQKFKKPIVKTSREHINAVVKQMKSDIEFYKTNLTIDLHMSDPDEFIELNIRQLKNEYRRNLAELSEVKLVALSEVLRIHQEIIGPDSGFEEELDKRFQKTLGSIGSKAVSTT